MNLPLAGIRTHAVEVGEQPRIGGHIAGRLGLAQAVSRSWP